MKDQKTDVKKWLDDKVWTTKKVRMSAELDRNEKNKRLNYFLIYYSASLSVMSFLNLTAPDGFNVILWSSMISVILPSINIFVYKANYSLEANNFRESYLDISELESKVSAKLNSNQEISMEEYDEFTSNYNDILKKYRNHTEKDYKYFVLSQIENNNKEFYNKITNKDIRSLKWSKHFKIAVITFIAAIPIILIILKLCTMDMIKS